MLPLLCALVILGWYAYRQRALARKNHQWYLIAMDGWRGSEQAWQAQHDELLHMICTLTDQRRQDAVNLPPIVPTTHTTLVH